jgi:hypothetical protein
VSCGYRVVLCSNPPQGPALGNSHSSIIAFQAFDTTSAAEMKNAPPAARALAKQNQQRYGVFDTVTTTLPSHFLEHDLLKISA